MCSCTYIFLYPLELVAVLGKKTDCGQSPESDFSEGPWGHNADDAGQESPKFPYVSQSI